MSDNTFLTDGFEASRPHLRAVAYRMLGSLSEADDAVQEAWLRLNRTDTAGVDPKYEAELADSVGLAMLVVLETLPPAERLAFVLHDMFAVPFDEIAPIVGRSSTATRQLASRARRRVQGPVPVREVDRTRQREIVGAFLAASREGDFEGLARYWTRT